MYYEQSPFTKITVNNSAHAATHILSGTANHQEALHWHDQGKDFICVPNGTPETPFTDVTLLEKRGSVFIQIKDISISWMQTSSVLALHLYEATKRQHPYKKPARFTLLS